MTTKFAAVALLALAASTSALASPPPDSITKPLVLEVDSTDPTYSFGTVDIRSLLPSQTFSDFYTFHLDGISDVTFSATSDPLYKGKNSNVLLKAAVFDSAKLQGPNDFMGNGTISGSGLNTTLSFTGLAAGDYTIALTGHAIGNSGGNYYGNIGVTAAVPEPESVALALAGVGIVSLLARRRKA